MTETIDRIGSQFDIFREVAKAMDFLEFVRDPDEEVKHALAHHELNLQQQKPCCLICTMTIMELRSELHEARQNSTPVVVTVPPKTPAKRRRHPIKDKNRSATAKKVFNGEFDPLDFTDVNRTAGRQRVKNRVDKWQKAKKAGWTAEQVTRLKDEARTVRDAFNKHYGANSYPDLF